MTTHHPGPFTGTEASMIVTAVERGYSLDVNRGVTVVTGHGQTFELEVVFGPDGDELAWIAR